MKYRKKPVEVEAFRYGYDDFPSWFCKAFNNGTVKITDVEVPTGCDTADTISAVCFIKTLEGTHEAHMGDYIIHGIKGEIYPCKADIFKATYEQA